MNTIDLDFRAVDASEPSRKTKFFFQLLRASYGADTVARKWPTTKDLQLVMALKREQIEKLSLEEIRGAIDNASKQRAKGLDEWLFIDLDLILGGAKMSRGNSPDVVALLSAPPETPEQRQARIETGRARIANLKAMLGGDPHGT